MNDFTKDELEFILDGTRHWSNKNIPTPWVFEFKKKWVMEFTKQDLLPIRHGLCRLGTVYAD